jgi:hypothetical protein
MSLTLGCRREEPKAAGPSAAEVEAEKKAAADKAVKDLLAAQQAQADKAAAEKAAVDKAVAAKVAADKAAADKAAAEKALADKEAAAKAAAEKEKAAADIAAAEKAAAAKAVAEKDAADKAAAEKAIEKMKAESASLPPDLVEMKADIAKTVGQIDVTHAKLSVLTEATGDLDTPSQGVVEAIKTLESETSGLKKRASDMRDKGAAYFETWEKQLAAMTTPEIQALAAKRKDELAKKYAEVLTAMQETRAAFDPYWTDMTAIKKAVEDGLTPEKMVTFKTQVKNARDKSETVKTRVEGVSSKLNQVSVIYTKP